MKQIHNKKIDGIKALPAFPVMLVSVEDNIMVAAAFHFYSFNPPSVMIGIKPEKYTHELINLHGEFVINIPTTEQLEMVKICGKLSGRDSDKFIEAGFTIQRGKKIKSFLIEECPVNLECKVVEGGPPFPSPNRQFTTSSVVVLQEQNPFVDTAKLNQTNSIG